MYVMTRITERNPYRPGAGVSPLYLAGREAEQRRFRATLHAAPEIPANVRLTGLRGVGKSVLLKAFEDIAEDLGWLVTRVQVEPRHNTEAALRELLDDRCRAAIMQASRVSRVREAVHGVADTALGRVRLRWHDVELSFGIGASSRGERTLAQSLFEVVSTADRNGRCGFLLMLDEAQALRDDRDRNGEHPLSLLIAAVNGLQEKQLPVGLTLSGLPSLRTNLLRARTYTERMFRGEDIGSLGSVDAHAAFVQPLTATATEAEADLVSKVVQEVEGHPYFVQLWGAELWDAAQASGLERLTVPLLDAIKVDIYRRVDVDFYDGRFEASTPAEQDLLLATAACPYPPLRVADIRSHTERSEGYINVLLGRLVEQGVLYRLQKGQYEYTAPRFHDYLRRRQARRPGGCG